MFNNQIKIKKLLRSHKIVCNRKSIDEIIIATTKRKDDNKFVKFCAKENIKIFRGSENNVMSRVLKAAKKFKISTICEITGDCPIVDYEIVDKLIKNFLNSKFDYFSMKGSGYPHGIGAQIFKLKTSFINIFFN